MRSLIHSLTAFSAIVAMACVAGPVAVAGTDSASNYEILVHRGTAQLEAGHADQAAAIAEQAIKSSPRRWEGYVLAGGALMNLKRYEDAADRLSDAIERAPADKQRALRELRRRALAEEAPAGPAAAVSSQAGTEATTTQAEIVMWKSIENSANPEDFQSYLNQYPQGAFAEMARRNLTEAKARLDRQHQDEIARLTWTDPATKLMWYRTPSIDNDPANHVSTGIDFPNSVAYCAHARIGGYTDWRLPTVDEIMTIYPRNTRQIRDEVVDPTVGEYSSIGKDAYRKYFAPWTSTPGRGEAGYGHFAIYHGVAKVIADERRFWGWSTNGIAICVRSAKP